MHGLTLATREYPTVRTHLKQQLKARQKYCIMYLVCLLLVYCKHVSVTCDVTLFVTSEGTTVWHINIFILMFIYMLCHYQINK